MAYLATQDKLSYIIVGEHEHEEALNCDTKPLMGIGGISGPFTRLGGCGQIIK